MTESWSVPDDVLPASPPPPPYVRARSFSVIRLANKRARIHGETGVGQTRFFGDSACIPQINEAVGLPSQHRGGLKTQLEGLTKLRTVQDTKSSQVETGVGAKHNKGMITIRVWHENGANRMHTSFQVMWLIMGAHHRVYKSPTDSRGALSTENKRAVANSWLHRSDHERD